MEPRESSPLMRASSTSSSPEGTPTKSDISIRLPRHSAEDTIAIPTSLHEPFSTRLRKRAGVLVGLLIFQSCSSAILASFEKLLQRHPVVIFFLTMLVGAGGNAGNQAAVLVIRGLATGEITARSYARYLLGECQMALAIAVPMVIAGYCRVKSVGGHSERDAIAIAASLLSIVISSVIIGSVLPFVLHRMRVDPAHAGATIQVIMDLAGVCITCTVCSFMLREGD